MNRSIRLAALLLLFPTLASAQAARRRPSMVGYVGDATIGSQIRVRYDIGSEIDAVDRAEFFYGKCGCYRGLPTTHVAYDPDAPGPGPGVVTDLDYRQLNLLVEIAAGERLTIFGELPYRWIEPKAFAAGTGSFSDQSGISDLRAGAKLGLVANERTALTLLLASSLPTGDSEKGLGTNHVSVEPALLVHQGAGRFGVEAQVGAVIPTSSSEGVPVSSDEDFAGKIIYYGIGPSLELVSSESFRLAPVVELVGWRILDGLQTAEGDPEGMNIVNLKIGARAAFGVGSSIYVGYGTALTDDKWYQSIIRLEFRRTM
jgi:hypothetical protein